MTNPMARCRICGCTQQDACDGGCGWTTAGCTLCTRCFELAMQIADTLHRVAAPQSLASQSEDGLNALYWLVRLEMHQRRREE